MAEKTVLVILFAVLAFTLASRHDIYKAYSVHSVEVRTLADQYVLHDLELSLGIDIWQHGYPGKRDAEIMVSPENSAAFLDELDKNGMKHYLLQSDVAKSFDEFDVDLNRYRQSRARRLVPFENYPRYAEIDAYLERIAAENPDIVTLVNAGPSFEGRPVKYVKISTTTFADTSKPVYFMEAMLHAREWVTTPVTLYTIHRLVEDLRTEDRDLLEETNWIIMPLVNPDGYEYTHTNMRLWRRTRSFNPEVSQVCYGVDANRNFDHEFNTIGVSNNPCSDTYPGSVPFSELETGYVRDIIQEHRNRIQLFIDIHSHGNYVLFGYDNLTVPDSGIALHHTASLMGAVMDSMKLPQAPYYEVGNGALVLYPASGTAQDYVQDAGIPFSYTLELPAYGQGFQVPPEFIGHINEETWQGIAATARAARLHYGARVGN